jgi:hypothetical protein
MSFGDLFPTNIFAAHRFQGGGRGWLRYPFGHRFPDIAFLSFHMPSPDPTNQNPVKDAALSQGQPSLRTAHTTWGGSYIMPKAPPSLSGPNSAAEGGTSASRIGSQLRSSFINEINTLTKPTLSRLAVSYVGSAPFSDPPGLARIPTTTELFPEGVKGNKEAQALCVPGTAGNVFILGCACFIMVGSVAAKEVLMAVSVQVKWIAKED